MEQKPDRAFWPVVAAIVAVLLAVVIHHWQEASKEEQRFRRHQEADKRSFDRSERIDRLFGRGVPENNP